MRGQTNASNIGGTVGSDTKPIKIVNGVPRAVTNELMKVAPTRGTATINTTDFDTFSNSAVRYVQIGKIVIATVVNVRPKTTGIGKILATGLPLSDNAFDTFTETSIGSLIMNMNSTSLSINANSIGAVYNTIVYLAK